MYCLILDVKIKNKISIGANSTGIIDFKSSKSTKIEKSQPWRIE